MKKINFNHLLVLIVVCSGILFHSPSYAEDAAKSVPPVADSAQPQTNHPAPPAQPEPAVTTALPPAVNTNAPENPTLEEARALVEMGKLVEARDHYRALLTHEGISEADKKATQSELETLNIKILFSPIETEDSVVYTVEKGDSLYKIAKKNGTTIDLLRKGNALSKDIIRPGMKLKVSKAKFSIEVDKSDNTLILYSDGMLFKTYRVATGTNASTPVGEFTIENKLENPTWYNSGAIIPPDSSENILGTRWLGFDLKGYGIHGTTQPETIGSQASKGCVRMLNQEVEELYSIIPVGTKVLVKE